MKKQKNANCGELDKKSNFQNFFYTWRCIGYKLPLLHCYMDVFTASPLSIAFVAITTDTLGLEFLLKTQFFSQHKQNHKRSNIFHISALTPHHYHHIHSSWSERWVSTIYHWICRNGMHSKMQLQSLLWFIFTHLFW